MNSILRSMRAVLICATCLLPLAASALRSDFEDGTLQGWMPTQTGTSGSTRVEDHLGSNMALVQHAGPLLTSLSKDFAYVPSAMLVFDMQAVSTAAGSGAYAGVTISFLNALNVSLGSVSLLNTNFPAGLGQSQLLVDTAVHRYSGSMSGFAASAGIASTTAIASMSVKFVASGRGFGESNASVWFDNVTVGGLPPTCSLQLSEVSFVDGESIVAKIARLRNPDAVAVPVEVKLWFEPSNGLAPTAFMTVGADATLVLPGGFDRDYAPLTLALVDASVPRGPYQFRCRLLHAITGALLSESAVAYDVK